MRPEQRCRKSSQSLADRSRTSELGCENQQYVQTEWMSSTLHVPRQFPSHKSIHTSTCSRTQTFSHNSCASTALCLPFADQDSTKAMHKHAVVNYSSFPLAATDGLCTVGMENTVKSQRKVEEITTISSQWLKLGGVRLTNVLPS